MKKNKKEQLEYERELIRKAQLGDVMARKELHRVYKGLVDSIVFKSYGRGNQPPEALRLDVEILLDKFIDKIDVSKDNQPSTYLQKSITQKLQRQVNDNTLIRLVENVNIHVTKFNGAKSSLYNTLQREPTNEEILKEMNSTYGNKFNIKQVERFQDDIRNFMPSSKTVGGEDTSSGISIGDMTFTKGPANTLEDLQETLQIQRMKSIINMLPEPDKSIFKHFEGWDGMPKLSTRQIAVKYGMNRYQVEKVIKEIQDKLRGELGIMVQEAM